MLPKIPMWVISLCVAVGCPAPTPTLPETPTPDTPRPPDPQLCADAAALFDTPMSPWDGDLPTCSLGTPQGTFSERAIARMNFARDLAGVRQVTAIDPTPAQGCALLLAANDQLTHDPPPSWSCFDEAYADAAGRSLVATLDTLDTVQGFLVDPGNRDDFGHRRWMTSPWVQGAALGAADGYSCLDLDAPFQPSESWVAWPPPGDTPLVLLELRQYTTDDEGWMIQSDGIDLSAAEDVVLTWPGVMQVLEAEVLPVGFGSTHALRFLPQTPVPVNAEWTVEIRGISPLIRYTGRKVDCGVIAP